VSPLPAEGFDLSEWSRARVNIDYHIAFDTNYYSVPYNLVQELVEVRWFRANRLSDHVRGFFTQAQPPVQQRQPMSTNSGSRGYGHMIRRANGFQPICRRVVIWKYDTGQRAREVYPVETLVPGSVPPWLPHPPPVRWPGMLSSSHRRRAEIRNFTRWTSSDFGL